MTPPRTTPQTPPPAPPTVPAGTRVYAIGDSHGCVERLRALHQAILADRDAAPAAGPPATRWVVVYLGDYVDRGPDSRGVIDLLLSDPLPGFESVYLKGNHEDLMLGVLDEGQAPMTWLVNGGGATLESYGIDPEEVTRDSRDRPPRGLAPRLPAAHLDFLHGLALSHVEGDYLFVHAGIRPGIPLDAQRDRDLLWIRDAFLDSDADHGKVVVHGHTPSRTPELMANRIGIDTGACFGGCLTAVVLEGAGRRLLQA
jgi:serine/threonine protein phosphatase 1